MKTRNASYNDYGMADSENNKWLEKCRNADCDMEQIMLQAAQESNEGIASTIFFSLRFGVSYERLIVVSDIPINRVDFYAYRRKALFLVKEKMINNNEEIKEYFTDTGVIRRFCNVADACKEIQIDQTTLLKVAKAANAVVKFGVCKRIDMTALYSYIDRECKEVV